MSRAAAWSIGALALLCGSGADAQEDPLARLRDGLSFDRFIQKTLTDYAVPGAVVAVVRADGTVFVKGYGVRKTGEDAPVDPDTRFQIASLSKFVTATAVGTLVDRGTVGWDDPVHGVSPQTELSVDYATRNATLRDYFAHRTGLPAYTGDLLVDYGLTADELVRRARFLPFGSSFRFRWAYSNYGIFLGQHAAAQAAGLSAPELIAKRMFEPLAMTRSAPRREALFEDENRAASHDLDGSVMESENVDAFSGAGALVSTGADMARWLRMLLAEGELDGTRILSKAAIAQLYAASMVEGSGGPLHDPNAAAGLGCDSYAFLRARVIEKNGALNGIRTIVTLIPELKTGILVLSNRQLTVFPEAVRAEFLERVIGPSGRDLQAQIRAEQPLWASLVSLPKPPADAAPMPRAPAAYAGRYDSPFYGPLAVATSGEGLSATIGGQPARLTHWSGDTFLLAFANPDLGPGLLTFAVSADAETAASVEGSPAPMALGVNYGRFERVP